MHHTNSANDPPKKNRLAVNQMGYIAIRKLDVSLNDRDVHYALCSNFCILRQFGSVAKAE